MLYSIKYYIFILNFAMDTVHKIETQSISVRQMIYGNSELVK